MEFEYNSSGQRVIKKVLPNNGDHPTTTYYVRDASGNIMATYEHGFVVEEPDLLSDGTTAYLLETFALKEQHLYGSSRLGILGADVGLAFRQNFYEYATGTYTPDGNDYGLNSYLVIHHEVVGHKNYELTNHLGNVLATITDRKVPNLVWNATANNYDITYFNAQATTITDYYPFGQQIEERSWTAPYKTYRFGFNGKEMDSEGMGGGQSTYDYGFRIYNPAIAKFLSVDPLTKGYAELTPYQFASNTPIIAIDLDGLEAVNGELVKDINGETKIFVSDKLQVYQLSSNLKYTHSNYTANLITLEYTIEGKTSKVVYNTEGTRNRYWWGLWHQDASCYYITLISSMVSGKDGNRFDYFLSNKLYEGDAKFVDLAFNKGVGNTFRHFVVTALMTISVGAKETKSMMDLHERETTIDKYGNQTPNLKPDGQLISEDGAVDILNNEFARQYVEKNIKYKNNSELFNAGPQAIADMMNAMVVYILSNDENLKNDAKYKGYIDGSIKVFDKDSAPVKEYYEKLSAENPK